MSLIPKAETTVSNGITVLHRNGRKVALHCLAFILVQVNMGIIEQVTHDELQGREGQWKAEKVIQERKRFTPLLTIRSVMSFSPKAKVEVWQIVRITVLQGKESKVMLHYLGPMLLPVNIGIIEQVA